MKLNPLTGRLGNHRFHSMLVHFPAGLYPFSFVADLVAWTGLDTAYSIVGKASLIGAVGMSVLAMIYGASDFLTIDAKDNAWKKAGIHALLNVTWFLIFCGLLFYRLKPGAVDLTYLIVMGATTAGMFYSNYLGADLIINHGIGVISKASKQEKEKKMLTRN